MKDYLLLVFPLTIIIILFWRVKIKGGKEFNEVAWSVDLEGFLKKRLPKILVPFLVANILYLFTVSFQRITEVRHVFTSIFGFTLLNGNAWFVVELCFLYIAFYFCMKKSSTERAAIVKLFIFAILLVTVSLLLGHDGSAIGGHWFMGEWWYNTTLIFIMGIIIAKNEDKLKRFMMKRYWILLPVFIIALAGWYFLEELVQERFGYYMEWDGHPGYPEKFFTMFMQVILCALFMLCILLINMKAVFKNRVLTFLGGISFEIYLIHDIFRQLLPGGINGRIPDFLYIGLTYGLSVITAWFFSKVDHFLLRPEVINNKKIVSRICIFYILVFIGMIVTEGIAMCN